MATLIAKRELTDNPTPRVPICLCLDTSGSMRTVIGGDYTATGRTFEEDGETYEEVTGGISRLDELQEGLRLFMEAIREDDTAASAADICIVTFDDTAQCLMPFADINRQTVPRLIARNDTAMGEGVNLALELLERRKQEYRTAGVDYYQPWLVLMTDGTPNGSESELEAAASRATDLANNRKLTVFPIGIGPDADKETLARFSPRRTPLSLKGMNFREFFEWLSKSVQQVSRSVPGESVPADVEGIRGWGEL
ncbi:MAG: VWA domain-containing protein [Akkermansia muciniphila]|nr:VWA domain-containing protein [Akkermansia muciniphila]